jgi:hypothetical protein
MMDDIGWGWTGGFGRGSRCVPFDWGTIANSAEGNGKSRGQRQLAA